MELQARIILQKKVEPVKTPSSLFGNFNLVSIDNDSNCKKEIDDLKQQVKELTAGL